MTHNPCIECAPSPGQCEDCEITRLTFLHGLDHKLADQFRARAERAELAAKNFRAVLEGAEFENLDMLAVETLDCRRIGEVMIERVKEMKARAEPSLPRFRVSPPGYPGACTLRRGTSMQRDTGVTRRRNA